MNETICKPQTGHVYWVLYKQYHLFIDLWASVVMMANKAFRLMTDGL